MAEVTDPPFAAEAAYRADLAAKLETAARPAAPPDAVDPPAAPVVEQPPTPKAEHPVKPDSASAVDADSDDVDTPDVDEPETDADDEFGDEDAPDELDPEFEAALKSKNVTTALDELPEALRPLAKAKLLEMDRAFTRLRQEDTEYKRELNELRVEKAFNEENFVTNAALRFVKDPAFQQAVNAKIEELQGHPQAATYAERELSDARTRAQQAVQEQERQAQSVQARVAKIDTLVERIGTESGLTMKNGIPRALRLLVADAINENGGRASRTVIEQTVRVYAREVRQERRAAARAASAAGVQARIATQQNAPKVTPGAGTTPAPSPSAVPKNDKEYGARLAERLNARVN